MLAFSLKTTSFVTPMSSSARDRPITPRQYKSAAEPFYAKLISIRVVLVCITLLTVIIMGIGLILLSVDAQNSIVDGLSNEITDQVVHHLTTQSGSLFEWADTELKTAQLAFQLDPNLSLPGNGTNPFKAMPAISEYLWSIVRKHPVGIETEFDFLDGRLMGFESFEHSADIYWADWEDEVLYEYGWAADLNKSIASINMSTNYLFDFPFGNPYPWISDPTRGYLMDCNSPSVWFDLWVYIGSVANYYIISDYSTICNSRNEMIGFLAVSLGLSSITELLQQITTDVKGEIFIMDAAKQLVASSTDSQIFSIHEDKTSTRETIYTTNETWIKDVVAKLDGNYNNSRQTVSINGTTYYLSIVQWNEFTGIDWNFVLLLEQKQFLGQTHSYFLKSIIAATLVSVAAVGIVLIVTWATTKPLFILAKDLQKMSTLDLEISDMETPRLFEVGKLYKSVASMYLALVSFKKFVPAQIISKIIKSEREATAELSPSKVTIVFQDIEGFTGLSEIMDPMSLAKLTSEYMETMTEIICKHGGTIDKYIGDCIMSLFNAPEPLANHQFKAAKSAVECIKALAKKNIEWQAKYGCQMQCRIGINSGDVLIGNMGSNYRMNYTAFGDNVNVAARLEGANKYFGTRIIVSKAVLSCFTEGQFTTRKLSKVRVSGKALPTSIFEVRAEAGPDVAKFFRFYESALRSFKRREFEKALEYISNAQEIDSMDVATLKLRDRIQSAIALSPLPESWLYVEDLLK